MPKTLDKFLTLPEIDQREAILAAASLLEMAPNIIEKDLWVCWCLKTLFEMPASKSIVFKGGTSLSKVYNAIFRFSEDVDITIDYRILGSGVAGPNPTLSSKQRKATTDIMEAALRKFVIQEIEPHFRTSMLKEGLEEKLEVRIEKGGEELHVLYKTALVTTDNYLLEPVKLEFGGKNSTKPRFEFEVRPLLAELDSELLLPVVTVNVLSGERTFWEKATLAHSESNKGVRLDGERMSRHWYDLYILTNGKIGASAIEQLDLLENVLVFKNSFYYSAASKYTDCLDGNFKLLPDADGLIALKVDYEKMLQAGLVYIDPPSFDQIISRLRELELEINSLVIKWRDGKKSLLKIT